MRSLALSSRARSVATTTVDCCSRVPSRPVDPGRSTITALGKTPGMPRGQVRDLPHWQQTDDAAIRQCITTRHANPATMSVELATLRPVSLRKQRKNQSSGSPSPSDPALPFPRFTLQDLEPFYEQVQRLRHTSPLLSQDEKEFRKHLTELNKFLERQSRKAFDQQTCSDLRRVRQMRDRLNGISGPPKRRADPRLAKDWAETRDYSPPAARRAMPRGGVRHVVRGGAPSLGKRK
jgi:hypothetical protein